VGEEPTKKNIIVPRVVLDAVQSGDIILLDDGKLMLEVVEVVPAEEEASSAATKLHAKVLRGGRLTSHKSIKIEGRHVQMPVLTERDIENIKLAKTYGVTALMQPFVLSGEDLRYVREVLKENHAEDIRIFAKIENRMGVERLDGILPEADVIVIARGDLGNDMPLWELPAVQKQIEEKCKEYNKPYIVVTQMLASMEEHPLPTRAEVSDIFHAVYHGAWGVMITGESAIGKYPVEAVRYLARTAESAALVE
jgi:pyruvate kinase